MMFGVCGPFVFVVIRLLLCTVSCFFVVYCLLSVN